MAPDTKIHYFEYYPHYMGTMRAEVTFTLEQLQQLQALAIDPDDEEFDNLVDVIVPDTTLYALHEALTGYPESEDQFTKILANLEKGEDFGDGWEEGSFAFSPISMDSAISTVTELERANFELDC